MTMRQVTSIQVISINVPFTKDNVKKCRCTLCPVQLSSQCFEERVIKMQYALKANRMDPKEIPAVYCSHGPAYCMDIDPAHSCICTTCQVFSEYNLSNGQPAGYFCRDGKAHSK